MIETKDYLRALDQIEKATEILLITHTRPDGDGCACVVAMQQVLKSRGKNARSLFLSEVPRWYQFLFDRKPPVVGKDITAEQLQKGELIRPDLIVIMDTNSYSQLQGLDRYLRDNDKPVVVIDHHITSDRVGNIELVDTTAAATGLIVLDLLKYAGWEITSRVANALFVAVATDTGWFQFTNTDARVFQSCAELISLGADPIDVHRRLYQNLTPERFKLMVTMLGTLELHFDGRYAAQHITLKDFEHTGARFEDTENLIDECRRIGTVEAAALFVEQKDGRIRCSLRSCGDIDVRKIAQIFGGGGHKMAAGTHLPGPLEKARSLVLEQMARRLSRP